MPKKQDAAVAEQQVKDQETVATSQQTENGNQAAVIYLGPAIAGVAVPGTVYRNGLTPKLEEAVKECPTLKRLLVETGNAQKTRKDLAKNPQSAASICYQNVLEYAKKKGAKG